jgi:membrane protein implicated in regulation of membrane protease activity
VDFLNALEPHYSWLALGLFLATLEMAIPGVFLIWLAGAALVTGLLTWVLPIGVELQIVVFAVLAIVAVFAGRRYLRNNPIEAVDARMNDRGAQAIGETVQVTHAIDGGTGRVKLGDSEWLAKGPDAAPGTRMRVSGHDGAILLVEHLQ